MDFPALDATLRTLFSAEFLARNVGLIAAMAGLFALAALGAGIASVVNTRRDVTRRAGLADGPALKVGKPGQPPAGKRPGAAFEEVLKVFEKQFVAGDVARAKQLRAQLTQAGHYGDNAAAIFFFCRFATAAVFGIAILVALPMLSDNASFTNQALFSIIGAVLGYILPSVVLDRQISARKLQIRSGFPDFMDLMVVCAEAGLAIDAALDRVSRELAVSYPALSENLRITCLEVRAGRTMTEALGQLAARTGLDEARSFATLLQQSQELGSSLSQSLRVYSDDMRNKRMMRAEEKAYSLPAKMVVPLTLFIFPIIIVTLMLPVIVRFMAT
jgi:tight adherence protein C